MEEDTPGFFTQDGTMREMQYVNSFLNAITLEMSFMHRGYDRSVYSTLDFLADIGGLFAALQTPFMIIIGIVNFNSAY